MQQGYQLIAVVNQSTLVTNEQAYEMALACDWQARHHAAPALGIIPPVVGLFSSAAGVPADAWTISLFDDADQAGDLGWHTEGPQGQVYGRVFARPVLDNGGDVLTAKLSVCSVLSHEVLETIGDPACNRWADLGTGSCYAQELGDPVESDSYEVTVGSVSATVSNFVMPAWFDPGAQPGSQFDWMRLLSQPFEVRSDGYVIEMSGGTVTQHWGREYPGWRKQTKLSEASRTSRRIRSAAAAFQD